MSAATEIIDVGHQVFAKDVEIQRLGVAIYVKSGRRTEQCNRSLELL